MDCVFCQIYSGQEIVRNELAKAIYDQFPVSPGHILIIPSRHVPSYFELTLEEENAMRDLLWKCRDLLEYERLPSGYNIGVNVGKAAGQTVFHVHVHLIPRYDGDVDDPTGGVRNTIPGMGQYTP